MIDRYTHTDTHDLLMKIYIGHNKAYLKVCFFMLFVKQGYALKNWVEVVSDEPNYPCESPKKID